MVARASYTASWILAGLVVVALVGCDSKSAGGSSTTGSTAPLSTPAAQPSGPPAIETLKKIVPDPTPLTWSFVDNATASIQSDNPATPGFKPFTLTASATAGLHRVGLQQPPQPGEKTYLVTAWIKTSSGTDAMFELAALDKQSQLTDYAVSYFDMSTHKITPNAVVTDKTQMKDAQIQVDGGWTKISGSIKGNDNLLSIVVGMVKGKTHVFQGTGAETLTVGGITIAPLEKGVVAPSVQDAAPPKKAVSPANDSSATIQSAKPAQELSTTPQ